MKKLLLLLILITGTSLYAQVGIGTDMPNPSTQLEIKSSNRGILIPQVPLTGNTDQATINAGNLESLLVYNTNTNATVTPGYYYWYQGSWKRLTTESDLPEHIVLWDFANNQFTYIDQNGDVQVINPSDFQTLTSLKLNADGHTLDYVDENGDLSSIGLESVIKNFETLTTIVSNNDGTFTFTDEAGVTTIVDISNLETLTSIALNPDNAHLDYTDEHGVVTQLDLTQVVKNLETLTTIVTNADGTFTFTDEAGVETVINVSSLETLTSIALNADNIHIDYTDEHGVVTELDLTQVVKNLETLTTIVTNADGTFTFTDEAGVETIINVSSLETLTSIALNPDNIHVDYTDENGLVTPLDFTQIVKNLETLTTVVENIDGTFTYMDEAGNTTIIDIKNLETLTTLVDNGDGTMTFTDENNVETIINLANGPKGDDGKSAFQVWLDLGNTGNEADFIASLKGDDGADGVDGAIGNDGASAYDSWIAAGNTGSEQDFLDSLIGADGNGILSIVDNGDGTYTINYTNGGSFTSSDLTGPKGDDGNSAYDVWIANGNAGTVQDFLDSLKGVDGPAGANGIDGKTPEVGANGNWFIDGVDTGVPAAGADGKSVTVTDNGDGTVTVSDGVNDVIISKGADGVDGDTPLIGPNGNWQIGGTDTGIAATGADGQDGIDGADGVTPVIGANGTWEIDGVDTGIAAQGVAGDKGDDGLGIASITDNGSGIFTITYTDNTTYTSPNLTGPKGDAGADGADGADGASVTVRDNGDDTVTISDGTNEVIISKGTDGVNGASAYEIWVASGNTGTEQDFINSLKGEAGADGINGTDGIDGVDGTNGVDGKSAYQVWIDAGHTGSEQDFINSLKGEAGLAGADGADGKDGVDGQDGSDGRDGDTPIIASNGNWQVGGVDTGIKAQGIAGDKGDKGDDGVGIASITDNGSGIFTITYTDNTTYTSPNLTGPQGETGVAGASVVVTDNGDDTVTISDGTNSVTISKGVDGADGATPEIGTNGTWEIGGIDTGIAAQGPAGTDGLAGNGIASITNNGDGTYTISYTDGGSFTTSDLTGPAGTDGEDGAAGNGIVSTLNNGDGTFTITYTDGATFTTADFTGAQGEQGPQGIQGPAGPQGIPGEKGETGDAGAQGPTGPQGEVGPVGPQGPVGPAGLQGIPGEKGETGDQGIRGEKGDRGDMGPVGPQGADGAPGAKGDTGSQGPVGPQGPAGPQGIPGEKGETGDQGIRGEKGDRGDMGPVGPQGADGAPGAKGDSGSQGPVGPIGPQGPAGPQGPQGPNGVVDPKNLTAGDTSITVTDGTGATLIDANISVADAGITTIKLADAAVTSAKVHADVAGVGMVKNTTTNALDVQANNGLNVDTTTDAVQLGGALIKPTEINTDATNTLAVRGLQPGTFQDDIVVIDRTSGVIKQLKAAMPTFFYMPSVVVYTAADQVPTGETFGTIDLYAKYNLQFGSPAVVNPGATTALPVLPAGELDYFITWFDESVFENVTVSNAGILTYTIKAGADVTMASFMNIVFSVKP
ncbi:hypothetical protein [Gelidibacter sp.]|uniref:hypothetical protein n=1 Tax=Gelidibacter sp. TaxID=2018083 RepID=UPI002C3FEFE5|nr:hypothetical protein [Gelidibacter sp.]HUH27490.1 hypothetical protein [Gelidibacter sp.]